MKFYDTHYDEYIKSNEEVNLHPNLTPIYKKFPNTLKELKNIYSKCNCKKLKITKILYKY